MTDVFKICLVVCGLVGGLLIARFFVNLLWGV